MSDSGTSKRLPNGLYDRLIYADEAAQIEDLAQAHRALVSEPSALQRREHLVDEMASRLPELLDDVTSSSESITADFPFLIAAVAYSNSGWGLNSPPENC